MAIACPKCGTNFDVTLFEFGRSVQCDCGQWVDLKSGHAIDQRQSDTDKQTGLSYQALTPPDRCSNKKRWVPKSALRRDLEEVLNSLFGATPGAIVGCILQWITIIVAVVSVRFGSSLPISVQLGLPVVGVVMLFAGLYFALRGKACGPIIAIGGIVGVVFVFVISAVVNPWSLINPMSLPRRRDVTRKNTKK